MTTSNGHLPDNSVPAISLRHINRLQLVSIPDGHCRLLRVALDNTVVDEFRLTENEIMSGAGVPEMVIGHIRGIAHWLDVEKAESG